MRLVSRTELNGPLFCVWLGGQAVTAGLVRGIAGSATLRQTGRSGRYFRTNVADRSGLERLFKDLLNEFGRLDILVNNAAVNIRKPLVDLDVADVEKVWDVALWGVFHCSQLAARQMVKQGGGSIVVISSVHAERPFPNSTSYNGAKATVNHMALTWAAELAKNNIRVNVIEPGWIDTPGERTHYTEEQILEDGRKLPLGRLGKAEEIATVLDPSTIPSSQLSGLGR